MAATYYLIAKNTLTSTSASVTFSSIPGTYTDLVIRISGRSTFSQVSAQVYMYFNSSTATNYSDTGLYTTGSGGSGSFRNSGSTTAIQPGVISAGTATTSTFGTCEFYIPNYTASTNKPIGSMSVAESNVADFAGYYQILGMASLWRVTSAITTIDLFTDGSFATNSSFRLYGIKKS